MPRTAQSTEAGMVYHVLNRGNSRMWIFHKGDLYRFKRGKAMLLGSLRGHVTKSGGTPILIDPSRATSFTDKAMFVWSGKRHVYDVRTGDYAGYGESATIDLPSFEGRLLSLLPYRVEAVDLEAPEQASAGTPVTLDATVQTGGGTPAEHVLYFEVSSPSGVQRPLYCRTRVAPEGHASLTIPFALNDRTGEWTVMAIALFDGRVKSFETPHIEWANSYVREPVRGLWIVNPKYGLREAVEIRQRSNFDITCLMIPSQLHVFPQDEDLNSFFLEQYDELLSREYDVIVMRSCSPRIFRSDKLHPVISSVYERITKTLRTELA